MQNIGRKKVLSPYKWKVKWCGKNLKGWWEEIASMSKRAAKFKVKQQIKKEIDSG